VGNKEIEKSDFVRKMVTEHYAPVAHITRFGMKQVYQIILADRTMIKARISPHNPSYNRLHQYLVDNGMRLPKILKVIEASESRAITLTEWIDGVCHNNAINDREYLVSIPDRHYELMGEYLSALENFTFDGLRVSVHNLVWPQFVVSEDKMWLIDSEILYADGDPERWIIYEIICHPYTTESQKRSFIEGYAAKYDRRDFSMGMKMTELFIKKLRSKQ